MVNYQLGKIYKIVGDGNVYIGSTCEKLLSKRLGGHVAYFKRFLNGKTNYYSSYECLKNNNYYIELLETCPCNSKDELHVRERFWIEQLDCVNKCVPIRTDEEHIEINKIYMKKYHEKNRDNDKLYREKNREKNSEQGKLYREKNKDKISEYEKKRIL
jgi:hypothetical protein